MPFKNISPAQVDDMALASLSAKDPTKKDFFSTSLPRLLSGQGGSLGFGTEGAGLGGPTFGGLDSAAIAQMMGQVQPTIESTNPFGGDVSPGQGGVSVGSGQPGPATSADVAQGIVTALSEGKDPTQGVESAISSNQQDIGAGKIASFISTGKTLNSLSGLIGGLAGVPGTALALGPAGPAMLALQMALRSLAKNATKQNTDIAKFLGRHMADLEANVPGPVGAGQPGGGLGAAPAGPTQGTLGFGPNDAPSPVVFGELSEGQLADAAAVDAGIASGQGGPGVGSVGVGPGPGGVGAGTAGEPGDAGAQGGPGAPGDGGGGGAGAGGTVICTAYRQLGYLDRVTWIKCSLYARKLDPQVIAGYHRWGVPFSGWLKAHPSFAALLWPVTKWWTLELTGRVPHVIMRVAVPICKWLGR